MDLEKTFRWTVYGLFTSLAMFIFYIFVNFVIADSRSDHCYVTMTRFENPWGPYIERYNLIASIPWREDVTLGAYKTRDEALTASTVLCHPTEGTGTIISDAGVDASANN